MVQCPWVSNQSKVHQLTAEGVECPLWEAGVFDCEKYFKGVVC